MCPAHLHQVHHLDGDRTNNTPSNLVGLCVEHHREASASANPMSRSLTPDILSGFRDAHYQSVREMNERKYGGSPGALPPDGDEHLVSLFLDAVALHDLHQRHLPAYRNWDAVRAHAESLATFSEHYGARVLLTALEQLAAYSSAARLGMPVVVARSIEAVATSLIGFTYSCAKERALLPGEREVLLGALQIGHSLAHDGTRYLKDLSVVDAGGRVLLQVLRFACRHKYEDVEEQARRIFRDVAATASREGFSDSARWLRALEDDAKNPPNAAMPDAPCDLLSKIRAT